MLIQENIAFGLVIGCSIFGMFWGLVNTLLVSITQPRRLHRLLRCIQHLLNPLLIG